MSYGEGVLSAIMKQCQRRGIPVEESESVLAHLAEEHGKSVLDMNDRELLKVQRGLGTSFMAYLEGAKRRGEGTGPWPDASKSAILAAAKAGISISTVDGTGKGGAVTKKDVDQALGD